MKTIFASLSLIALVATLTGCTLGKIADRAVDECEAVVDENIEAVTMICEDLVEQAITQCSAEIESAIDAFEGSLEYRIGEFLIANGCVQLSANQWSCADSNFCPSP